MKKHIEKIKNNIPKSAENLSISDFKIPLLTMLIGVLLGYLVTTSGYIPNPQHVGSEKAKNLIENYLNDLGAGDVTVTEVIAEGDLYKVSLSVEGLDYTSYATKDGNLLFPQYLDLTDQEILESAPQASELPTEVPTSDKPSVELFVMSHCPYGTQAMKGILPAQELLGDKIDFEIKFVNYAMHGEVEVYEQLNQYCIQKELGRDAFANYLGCFLEDGDSEACLNSNNIDRNMLSSCTESADAEYSITANLTDRSTYKGSYPAFNTHLEENLQYGVQGSPTLIINGVQSSAGRDAASYLNAICNAFNEQPEECNTQLDNVTPTPGFGYGTPTTSTGTGNIASANAQCL